MREPNNSDNVRRCASKWANLLTKFKKVIDSNSVMHAIINSTNFSIQDKEKKEKTWKIFKIMSLAMTPAENEQDWQEEIALASERLVWLERKRDELQQLTPPSALVASAEPTPKPTIGARRHSQEETVSRMLRTAIEFFGCNGNGRDA
jgi:hypothetical protein